MIKASVIFILVAFSKKAFSANPLNTVNDYLNQPDTGGSSTGDGSGILLAFVILYFISAYWLLISYNSPMYEWANKNQGLACCCFFIFFPLLLSLILHLLK